MSMPIERVELALNELKKGNMVILTDHPDRENEGDLIIAAEHMTTEKMNFMIRHSSGIICVAMTQALLKKYQLPLLVPRSENTSKSGTPFALSIDAKYDITTGVSAHDRTKTIQAVAYEHSTANDFVKPGHVFPLQADDDGVFVRPGHTEGAIDLIKCITNKHAAALCELMDQDGNMMRGKELVAFACKHHIPIVSINDIMIYRLYHESIIEDQATTTISLEKYGMFTISVFKEKVSGKEHVLLRKEIANSTQPPLVRIHSACLTGDVFSSRRCDCHHQLHYALQCISQEGGLLLYLDQEGRGIGLLNKIKAYALQEQGYDTVDANLKLGLPADSRDYAVAANILRQLKITRLRLLTNNPKKISDLQQFGITEIKKEDMPIFEQDDNIFYLKTKKKKLKHTINIEVDLNDDKNSDSSESI